MKYPIPLTEVLLCLDESEYQVIKKNMRVMLLDSKSDELYTDRDFQLKQNTKYMELFQELKVKAPVVTH